MTINDVKRILVLVTPTRDCIDVVNEAIALAERYQASLYVLDVVHNPFAYTGWNLPMPSLDREYQRNLEQVRDRLQAMVREEKLRGFVIQTLIREGEPYEQITKVIEEEKIELLVLASHTEGRIEHYFSGRVADRLIRKMPCSVLLLKVGEESLCAT
jgi:nucleotide-binding universal stress UspA family protein